MTKHQLEVIEWYDHWGRTSGGWTNVKELEAPKPAIMKTVGWLVQETKDCIVLAPDLDTGTNDGIIKSYSEQCILKCAVKSRKKLNETPSKVRTGK